MHYTFSPANLLNDAVMKSVLNGNTSEEQMDILVASIRSSGAIQKALDEAREFVDRGIKAIADLPDNQEHRALNELAHYIVDREI